MAERGKVVGVLGGMGPEATLAFYEKLLAATPATQDQDHLQVIINSNPKIPDRTAAALGQGPSPVPAMVESIQALARAGASFVVIPCVSAHIFLDEIRAQAPLPVISILDVVAGAIAGNAEPLRCIGLMATAGTVRAGVFTRRLNASGIEVRCPGDADQKIVSAAIYEVKGGASETRRAALSADLLAVSRRLVADSAQGIVLGCTEIPLVFPTRGLDVPVFDSLRLLAEAAVAAAGLVPVVTQSARTKGEGR